MARNILWTKEKLTAFIERRDKALEEGEHTFWFEGYEFFTAYAKYVIAYVGEQFNREGDDQWSTSVLD